MKKSKHLTDDRAKREEFIKNTIGLGEDLDVFDEVSPKDGRPCRHIITDTGVYKIVSAEDDTLITMWIARPSQLKELYKKHHTPLPEWLLRKAIYYKQNYLTYVGESNPHYHKSTTKGFNSNLKPVRGKKNKKIIY